MDKPKGQTPDDEHRPKTDDGYTIVPQARAYDIHCAYIEYGRPPEGEDARGPLVMLNGRLTPLSPERHWRCPARFPFDPYAQNDAERTFCPLHRTKNEDGLVIGRGPESSRTLMDVKNLIDQFLDRHQMPEA